MKEITLDEFYRYAGTVTKEAFRLKFFPLKDRSIQTLPVAVIGKGGGPVVIVISAMHGNEINGVYCCHLIYNHLKGEEVNGKIILFPIANPQAYNQGERISSVDYIDMNRTFAFVKKRKPTEHLAGLLFERVISKGDILFDLHTGGSGEYTPLVVTMSEEASEEARYLNMGNVLQVPRRGTSLLPNCEKKGIRGFCIEMGRASKVNRDYCKKFLKGFLNFLTYKGIIEGEVNTEAGQRKLRGKIPIPAKKSGFFQSHITLGDPVLKGQTIGEVETLFSSEPFKVVSPGDGFVLYLRDEECVAFGDSLFHIGFKGMEI